MTEQAQMRLPDGVELRGNLWRVGDAWTLLLHEPGADHDIDELQPLARAVARSGASAVAFDLPGHGFSEGEWHGDAGPEAVRSLVAWMDGLRPAKLGIVALGAMCYPALQVAAERAVDLLVLVSPTACPDLLADPKSFRGDGAAKLLIAGGADAEARDTAVALRQRSIGWAVSLSVGTTEQGAALVNGAHAARVAEGVELFLREQWTMGRRRGVPANEREREIAR